MILFYLFRIFCSNIELICTYCYDVCNLYKKYENTMQSYKKEFAKFLVRAEVIQFGDFTLKSGRRSPYYFNSSKFSNGTLIKELGYYFASAIQEHVPNCNLIYGPAYKGIPLCITSAIELSSRLNQNIGYFFNRKEEKNHGDQGNLVGQSPQKSDFIVMVDDVISDGLTKIESVKHVRKLFKADFTGVIVALDRMETNFQAKDAVNEFQQKTGVPVWSIITIRELCDYLKDRPIDGSVAMDDSICLKIETYLAKYSNRS